MSNYLAIATVTAAFKRLLQAGVSREVPGTQVTTVRPESSSGSGSISGACINLFMYSATPNPAWRNADLRTRRPKADMTKHGQAGLDLNYILTFYGNEQRLEPQRLLGSTIQTLVDHPILTSEMIQDTILNANLPELATSTLDEQVQSVRFLPDEMTTDELSRLWSVFFQIPYSLSFTYRATAVLIQGRKPGKAPLPVRGRRFYTSPTSAALTKVEVRGELGEPCTLDSYLIIHGRQLTVEGGLIQFDGVNVVPTVATDTRFEIDLAALPEETRSRLRAGVQGVCLQLQQPQSSGGTAPVTTNVVPLVLCPVIVNGVQDITVEQVEEIDDRYCSATVTVTVDVMVDPEQSVFLLLNGDSDGTGDGTTIVRGDRRAQVTNRLTFTLDKVNAGEHLVRVQVGGAESPLEVDTAADSPTRNQYTGPTITIRLDSSD